MTEVRLEGVVEAYDHDRAGSTFPSIAGRDVINAIQTVFPQGHEVKVTLAVEPEPAEWTGKLRSEHGWTGTEVTPGDPPIILVGSRDLVAKLWDYDERTVILIVEEAPDA